MKKKNKENKNIILKKMELKEKENNYKLKKKIILVIILISMLIILACTYYYFNNYNKTQNNNNKELYNINYILKHNLLEEITNKKVTDYELYDNITETSYNITASINKNYGISFNYEKCIFDEYDNYICKKRTDKSDNILTKVKYIGNSYTHILALTEDGQLYQNELYNYNTLPEFTLFNKIKTNLKVDKLYIDPNTNDFYALCGDTIYGVDEYNLKLGVTYQELYPYPIKIYIPQYDKIMHVTIDNKLLYSSSINKNPNKNEYIKDEFGKTIIVKDIFSYNYNDESILTFIDENDQLYQMNFYKSDWKNGITAKAKLINDLPVKEYIINNNRNIDGIGTINIIFEDNSSKQINYTNFIYSTTYNEYYEITEKNY